MDHRPPATFEGKWIARTNRVAADDFEKDAAEDVELGITIRQPGATRPGAPSGTLDFNGRSHRQGERNARKGRAGFGQDDLAVSEG